ncbi:MAG: Arabinose operon regulatory protein [Pseudomonas citronellolis]|nr:MAG: Arabinose operon regulatory protein [Pseudomonas citronellolis]
MFIRQGDTCQYLGGVEKPFPAHSLSFIAPHRIHMIPHPDQGRFYVLNFAQEFLFPHLACSPFDLDDLPLAEYPELAPFLLQEHLDFTLDASDFAEVLRLVEAMRGHDAPRRFASTLAIRGDLLRLIALVCQRFEAPIAELAARRAPRKAQGKALRRITAYVEAHLGNPELALGDVAQAVFLTPNHVTHLLKKDAGYTFTQLVLAARLRKARAELLLSDKPIAVIANACGFADESYFSRCFRKGTGVPPGRFRKDGGK